MFGFTFTITCKYYNIVTMFFFSSHVEGVPKLAWLILHSTKMLSYYLLLLLDRLVPRVVGILQYRPLTEDEPFRNSFGKLLF